MGKKCKDTLQHCKGLTPKDKYGKEMFVGDTQRSKLSVLSIASSPDVMGQCKQKWTGKREKNTN